MSKANFCRLNKLEEKLRHELAQSKPSLSNIIEYVNEYEKDNLASIEKLKRERLIDAKKINGALKNCINAHGAITKILIGSATKRIMGSLLSDKPKETKESIFTKILRWIN